MLTRIASSLLFTASLYAQYTTGRIEGLVTDPSGAFVDGANIRLTSSDTKSSRSYTTSSDGLYFFAALPPGKYEITTDKQGFRAATVSVVVLTSQTVTQNIGLLIGDQPVRIDVVAESAPALQAFEPVRDVTRERLELMSLPNSTRNVINVISLAPGVTPTFNPRGGQLITLTGAQAGQITANGGRSKAASHQLDFTDANDWEFGGIALGTQPVPDMMQEFKILTNNWAAEYGVKASAQVLMVTRSGTNNFHGSAYDYLKNSVLNARDYFDRTGKPTPLRENQFGFTAGGPIIRDRTFLFGGYEGRRTRGAGSTVIATLPTQAARDRATDPSVRQILNLLPLPTTPTANPDLGTLASQLTSPSNNDQFIARGDHYFSPNHAIVVRYYQSVGSALNRLAGGTLPGFDATFDPIGRNAMIADTLTIDPRTTNEARVSYGRSSALFTPETDPATPRFTVTGVVAFGTVNSWPQGRVFNIYQLNDVFTRINGRHIIKAGFDLRNIRDNSVNDSNRRGVYTFPDLNTFLSGTLSQFQQVFGNTYRGYRTNFHAAFVQDDWKIRQNLTLNLGIRWEYQGGLREVNQLQSVLDPQTPGTIGNAGSGPLGSFRNESPVIEGNPALFAPRLGFAWTPTERLVIRGGYGIYFDSLIFNGLQAGRTTPPTNYSTTLTQFTGGNNLANLLAGTAPIQVQLSSQIGGFGDLTNLGTITTTDPRIRNPYMQHFSFGVQYKFNQTLVADVSYVGTKGTALTTYGPLNSVIRRPPAATSIADEQARLNDFRAAVALQNGPGNSRLDPRFNDVNLITDNGSSTYHSLQTELRKSLSFGLLLRASYTWSKSIDNSSDYSPAQNPTDTSFAQDQFNFNLERGISSFDIPHRFVLSHVYRWRGWEFSSINQLQTGIPATILAGARLGITDINLDGNNVSGTDNTRANCAASGANFTLGTPAGNTLYSQPLLGNIGTCGRNTFRMRALFNYDWSFAKSIGIKEYGTLEYRTDFFNIFNTPFLTATGNDWRTVSSPQFGLANAAGPARRIQMSLRFNW